MTSYIAKGEVAIESILRDCAHLSSLIALGKLSNELLKSLEQHASFVKKNFFFSK